MTRAAAAIVAAAGLVGLGPLASPVKAATPKFLPPPPSFLAKPAFGLVDVGSRSAPALGDLDGDGDLDAFVGNSDGNTTFFRNTGSSSAAAFAASSVNPFGLVNAGSNSVPAFADIDFDGDLDAFLGNSDGDIIFFRNTGSSSAAAFSASSLNPFGITDVGSDGAPTFVDIDTDGDLDAFVGNADGNTIFFRNTGSSTAAAFSASSLNPFSLTDVGNNNVPDFVDIDADGDLDAFVGNSSGSTVFFRNTGSFSAAAFGASSVSPFGLTDVGSDSAPTFADIDADGDIDAFVGNSAGDTIFFENTDPNPFGISDLGRYSNSSFADIDGDGDLDVFLGDYSGNIFFFENTGSSAAAAFATPIPDAFGLTDVGQYSNPDLVDIDGDGDLDAFVGEFFGDTLFFENTGSPTAAAFASSIVNPFGLTRVSYYSIHDFADIDGDGDLDVLMGNPYGSTVFFRNTGSSSAAAFGASSANPFGLTGVGIFSSPDFTDIDADGDLDALIGETTGKAIFFRNTGSSSAAAFAASSVSPFGLLDVGFDASPAFADIDADGDLDAFIGARSGKTFFFENFGCGNGGLDNGEECDDGNTTNFDGCSSVCDVEQPSGSLDVDLRNGVDVATDIVYIARRRLSLAPVPSSFRTLDPTIPPDSEISARIDALGASLDVDLRNGVDVATDIVYIARRRLSLAPVPPSFRTLDPTIPPDSEIAARIDALL